MAPAIIFIDEVDAAGRKRGAGIGQGNDEREQTLNQLPSRLDGFGGDAGVVVMAATNRPDILDPALLRPGRFDRQVVIDTPDVARPLRDPAAARPQEAGRPGCGPDGDRADDARVLGRELASVISEGALLAVRQGHATIDQPTLEEAIDRVVSGPAKKSHVLDQARARGDRDPRGVARRRRAGDRPEVGGGSQKLSIVARGRTWHRDVAADRQGRHRLQQADLERQLTAIVAGAAGERVHFGMVSTAINDDLHAATNLARSMVTSFGMSPELGLVTIGEQGGEVFLGASLQELGSVGPATLELIDREIERIVADAVERARSVLRANGRRARDRAGPARARDGVGRRARGAADAGHAHRDRGRPAQRAAAGGVIRRASVALALWAGLCVTASASADPPRWRLSSPRRRPARRSRSLSGRPGPDVLAPNRGLLAIEGNSVVPRGPARVGRRGVARLATVCGGTGDTMRIAWAV